MATRRTGRRSKAAERKEAQRQSRAWLAVKAFKDLQPSFTAFARTATGNSKLQVKLTPGGANGHSKTDGANVIYLQPPISLGDEIPHDRNGCNKRDPETLVKLCKACASKELLTSRLFHEIAHIAFKSTSRITAAEREYMRALVDEWHPSGVCGHGAPIKAAMARAGSHLDLAASFHPYLSMILKSYEDARIDQRMYEARPGLRLPTEARIRLSFAKGTEQEDGSWRRWIDAPFEAQAMIGLLLLGMGQPIREGYLMPEIIKALGDPELVRISSALRYVSSVNGAMELSVEAFRRLQEMGLCPVAKCVPPPPPPPSLNKDPQSSDQSDESGGDGDKESGNGESDKSDKPDESDEPDKPDESESPDGDGGSQEDEGGDSPSGSGDSSDESDGSDPGDGGDAGHSDDVSPSGEEEETPPDGGGSMSGDEEGDSDAESSDGEVPPDGNGEDPPEQGGAGGSSDDDPDGGVEDDHDGDASEPQAGDEGGESGEGDSAGISSIGGSEGAQASGSPDNDSGESNVDGSDGEPGEEADDLKSGSADSGRDVEAEGSTDPAEGLEDRDGPGDSDLDLDATEGELRESEASGADDVKGESVWDADNPESIPQPSDPSEVAHAVDQFLGHDAEEKLDAELLGENLPGEAESEMNAEAVELAASQADVFDTSSQEVRGVLDIHYPHDAFRWGDRRHWRIEDFMPAEQTIGKALLAARVVFAENRRAKIQGNLKSGKVNARVLGRRAALGDERLFKKRTLPGKRDYAVVITADCSGSTAGNYRNERIKRAVFAKAEILNRLGIPFAVYGHTGGQGDPEQGIYVYHPSRDMRTELWMMQVKTMDEPWNATTKERLAQLPPVADNLDGHTLEYCRKVLEKSNATDRILIYYTDGAMPAANYDEELEILTAEIEKCKRSNITLMAVGINTDSPERFGFDTVTVESDEDLALVVDRLKARLMK